MLDELKGKYFKYPEQVEIYNRYKAKMSNNEKYDLVLSLIIERDFWGYFELAALIMYELAEVSNEYLNLIETLHAKIKNDMAQAPFLNTLTNIGINKRDIALPLYEKILNESKPNELKIVAGLILGGFCKQNEQILFSYFEKDICFPLTNSILKAILACYNDKIPPEVYTYLNKVSITKDKEISRELANICLVYYTQNKAYFYEKIRYLIDLNEDNIRYLIFDRLTYQDILGEKEVFALIAKSLDSNKYVVEKIVEILRKYPEEYQQISEWLIYLINKDLDTKLRHFDWVLEKLVISNRLFIDYFLDNYRKIRRNNQNMYIVILPHLFRILSKPHIDYSLEQLNRFNLADKEQRDLFYKLNKVILGHIYKEPLYKNSLLKLIDNLLKAASKREYISINLSRYTEKKDKKEITPEEFNSLVDFTENLLSQLIERRESYNFKTIHKNIQKYPLVYYYAKDVLLESENKKQYTPLMRLGEIEEPQIEDIKVTLEKSEFNKAFKIQHMRNQFWSRAYLTELNNSLELVGKMPNGKISKKHWKKYIMDNISTEERFRGLFSELIFINKFNEKDIKEIEPKVPNRPGNNFDLKINLRGKDNYFEVTYPEINRESKLANGAVGLGNKSFSIIDKKYGQIFSKQTLEEMEQKKRNDFFFIVIDISSSAIDEFQLLNSLYGSLSLTMIMDKTSGKMVEQYESRQEDSISDKNQKTRIISGVIYFKKDLVFEKEQPKIILRGDIISNPNAINKPSNDELKELKRTIFG